MVWYSLIPNEFYTFICRSDNYATLNKLKLRFQDTVEIVKCFTDDSSVFQQLRDVIRKNTHVFQFIYTNLFPRYFSRIDDYGIRCRLDFDNLYKIYQGQKSFLNCQEYPKKKQIKTESVNEVDFVAEKIEKPPNTPEAAFFTAEKKEV